MLDLVKIREYAKEKHAGQKYGEHDYVYHLDMVYAVAVEHNLPDVVRAAAYLHDVLEDTPTTYSDIVDEFGSEELANLVHCVTDEKGKNRKERKALTYPKIRSNENAVALKLCDRIANILESAHNNESLFKMYRKEQPDFEANLKVGESNKSLWDAVNLFFKLDEGSNG